MSNDNVAKAAERARSLLRGQVGVGSVAVSRDQAGQLFVRVDVDPGTDKDSIRGLLATIKAPVVVRTVSGILYAH